MKKVITLMVLGTMIIDVKEKVYKYKMKKISKAVNSSLYLTQQHELTIFFEKYIFHTYVH